MVRYIAMIPCRFGSKRVPKKNLRLLGDKPLVAYVLETTVRSKIFDAIYLNSEADIFADIAKEYGATFYKRPAILSSDAATNDQFVIDFMQNVPGDVLVQLNPTSPFLTVDDIHRAKMKFENENYDTVLSVTEKRIEGVFQERCLNFNPCESMPPSQSLKPIYTFCNGIFAWRTETFKKNYEKYGCAVYGRNKRTCYLVLSGDSTMDIDNEEDFALAEVTLARRVQKVQKAPRYWGKDSQRDEEYVEAKVFEMLKRDGVATIDLEDVNNELVSVRLLERSWDWVLKKTGLVNNTLWNRYHWKRQLQTDKKRNAGPVGYDWGDPENSKDYYGDYHQILDWLQESITNHSHVVEIGSYGGKWTQYMGEARQVTCVDLFDESFIFLKERLPHLTNLKFYKTSGNELKGVEDHSVDLVFSMDTFVRIPKASIRDYFFEIYRVLKRGGEVLIHLPCSDIPFCKRKAFSSVSSLWLRKKVEEVGFQKPQLHSGVIRHGVILQVSK